MGTSADRAMRYVRGPRSGGRVSHLPAGPIHHIRLAVTDVDRSKAFYTEVLGFEVAVDAPPPPDDAHHEDIADSLQGGSSSCTRGCSSGFGQWTRNGRPAADRFDPLRVGLDHLSFSVPARADLDAAIRLLDESGVEHGPIGARPARPVLLGLLRSGRHRPRAHRADLRRPDLLIRSVVHRPRVGTVDLVVTSLLEPRLHVAAEDVHRSLGFVECHVTDGSCSTM